MFAKAAFLVFLSPVLSLQRGLGSEKVKEWVVTGVLIIVVLIVLLHPLHCLSPTQKCLFIE